MDSRQKNLLEEAKDRLKDAIDRESTERAKQLEDLKFSTLDQWPAEIRKQRENDTTGARPCLTIDKIAQYRMQIVNEIRKNRPAVKVRGVDSGSDPKTAEIFQGIIRHIEDVSDADIAYETAAEWAIDIGVGYFRIITEYEDEKSFNQEILIKPVHDAFSVYGGPHLMPDGSDAEYWFILEDMKEEVFKRKYPKAKSPKNLGVDSPFWVGEDSVRIAEYFYFDYEKVTMIQTADGKSMREDEYETLSQSIIPPPEIIDSREASIPSVKWCKLTEEEIISERDWAGSYLPVVKVVGHQKLVEGQKKTWGLIRPAIDSARMYNYWASVITEKIALSPKTPYVGAKGQFAGVEGKWEKANTQNFAYLEYEPIDISGNALPAPRRTEPAAIEAAMIQQLRIIEHDIQTSLGMFKASVGEEQGDQSGRAIRALQGQSDTATYHFPDNLARSIRHGGRIQIDLAPKILDTARIIRILGDDGKPQQVSLNPDQPQAMLQQKNPLTGQIQQIHNLRVGKYDVTVTVGPSYATKRMEAVDVMQDIMSKNPNLAPLIGDIAFRAMDVPYADQLSDRMHAMLPPALQKQGDQGPMPPQAVAQIQQLTQQIQMLQQGAQKLQQENNQLKAGTAVDMQKVASQHDAKLKGIAADQATSVQEAQLKRAIAEEEAKLKRDVAEYEAKLKHDLAIEEVRLKRAVAEEEARLESEKMALEKELRQREQKEKAEEKVEQEATSATPQFLKTLESLVKGQEKMNQQLADAITAPRVAEVTLNGKTIRATSKVTH